MSSGQTSIPFDIQGHRGCRGYRPENTLPGFLHALSLGAHTLELDVVISRDSQVIVSHEPYFSHVISTQPNGQDIPKDKEKEFNLFQMTTYEIQSFDVGRKGHPDFPLQTPLPACKPTLEQVVKAVELEIIEKKYSPVKYNIEIKRDPANDGKTHPSGEVFAKRVYDTAKQLNVVYKCNFQSFDAEMLRYLRQLDTDVPIAFLISNNKSFSENMKDLGFIPQIYSPAFRLVTRELVTKCHQNGLKIIPWTVNQEDDMMSLIKLGVDGIISDVPDKVVQAYHQYTLSRH